MEPPKVEVENFWLDDVGHISSITLAYQSNKALILHVDLATKGKEISCFSSGDGFSSFYIGGQEIRVFHNFEKPYHDATMTSRYSIWLLIFDGKEWIETSTDITTLWRKP